MNETLPVSAIKNGTVIDHIAVNQALRIVHLLGLKHSQHKITIGLHLPSKRLGSKDLIKIENRVLTDQEANDIVVFAPVATINVIENYEVVKKFATSLPNEMRDVFTCPNPVCITRVETRPSRFYIREQGKQIKLSCHYCEKMFDRDKVRVMI